MEKAKATLEPLVARVNKLTGNHYSKTYISTLRNSGEGPKALLGAVALASVQLLEEQAKAERKALK